MVRENPVVMEDLKFVKTDPQEKLTSADTILQEPILDTIKPSRSRTTKAKATPTTRRVNLENRIAAQLMSLNMLFLLSPWREDALSPEEIQALAHALNSQAQASLTFKRILESALSVGSSGELISVIMLIAVKRAARHGIIPEQFGMFATGMMPTGETNETEAGFGDISA